MPSRSARASRVDGCASPVQALDATHWPAGPLRAEVPVEPELPVSVRSPTGWRSAIQTPSAGCPDSPATTYALQAPRTHELGRALWARPQKPRPRFTKLPVNRGRANIALDLTFGLSPRTPPRESGRRREERPGTRRSVSVIPLCCLDAYSGPLAALTAHDPYRFRCASFASSIGSSLNSVVLKRINSPSLEPSLASGSLWKGPPCCAKL